MSAAFAAGSAPAVSAVAGPGVVTTVDGVGSVGGAAMGAVEGGVGAGGVLCHRDGACDGSAGSGVPRGLDRTNDPASAMKASAATPLPTQIQSRRVGASVRASVVGSRAAPSLPGRICDDDPFRSATVGPRVCRSGLMTGKRVPLCETPPPGLASMSSAELTVFFHCANSTSKSSLT